MGLRVPDILRQRDQARTRDGGVYAALEAPRSVGPAIHICENKGWTGWKTCIFFSGLPVAASPKQQVTLILESSESADPPLADRLLPLVYTELRRLAQRQLANEQPGQTLQAWQPAW